MQLKTTCVARGRRAGVCLFLLTTITLAGAQVAAPQPLKTVAYPHLKFNADGTLSAPDCEDVPKLLIGSPSACSSHERQVWLDEMRAWRVERRLRMGYSGDMYELPALQWTQASFVQPQLMIEDRYLYDPVKAAYTVDRYVDDTVRRYGGIDSVLIWPTYPNLGIDARNQYDLLRNMPGGLPAIKQMVADFHRRGVKVFFPVLIWDQGTRDEGKPDWSATAELMKAIGADGVNGDTMDGMPKVFEDAAQKLGHPLAMEPERFPGHDEMIAWNDMSWAYWQSSYAPSVSRVKWLEPRAMLNVCDRWSHDHTDNLQAAFFNGAGFESWENVWGIWNGMTPRDGETIRRIATIERGVAAFLVSADWQPYYPTERRGLFASYFPLGADAVWTIVNRGGASLEGALLRVKEPPAGARFFDLYRGVELSPERDGKDVLLAFAVEPRGYGAILQLGRTPTAAQLTLLQTMHEMTREPLASFSAQWQYLAQTEEAIAAAPANSEAPQGMVKIPAATFRFRVSGVEIEGQDDIGVDVQYPWEDSPCRHHDHSLAIAEFWMDRTPVTNDQFKRFLQASHYRPADPTNFLRDWKNDNYPDGWANKPVTWVSRDDARAYATWAGKRLPHEWEWQYAAQGADGRLYPWGNDWNPNAVPAPDQGRELSPPGEVDQHPSGASPFGVQDMVGNVWQWTDQYQDDHTRAAVLRGGSHYQPGSAIWYFPQAYRNDEHGKFLLMAPGEDRSGTVGFRCVMDAR
jgi:iron(II)-dependent oxidoreductase